MEFWGVEVKPGQPLGCSPGEDKYIHLSQVAIGEGSKSDERVAVYIHVDGKKIMIGSCVRGSCEQFGLDLVFEKDFKISHTSKSASVFCCGYTTFIQEEDEFGSLNGEDEDDDELESDEEMPQSVITAKENGGKQPAKAEKVEKSESKSLAMPGKSNKEGMKVKPEKPKQPAQAAEDDDDSDDDESDDDEDMEDLSGSEDDDDDDDEDSDEDEEDESDEETPKAPAGKKRPMPDSAAKTPVSDKKAKFATPEGHKPGDNKKNVHVATPHPGAKKGDKKGKETPGGPKQQQTPASKETPKSNASTPASAKKFSCQPCQRSFVSEAALNSHNSAKHGAT